ncbi:type II secretion system major pseudopilin GspG [Bradyrhizobium japonicum]|uniref:type II secretion system major pseudopilin GspG n=1 Tax=Bradyrhizobium japonicum TaxID=375 RepID=UPI001BA66EA1|nr:type II secretion system major pseudopilin GspG [Bradyrhizobium japonicum]MBR0994310.1 type II secretion system major pseudopilin GspG [Bradyrhizobium japonicum]
MTVDTSKMPAPQRSRKLRVHRRRAAAAGYTLLELLVVMGILAALTAMATPQVMGYFGKAKTQSAQLQIENINTALEMYFVENGSYPSSSAGLRALVEATPEAPRWNGPYLKNAKTLLDPWGRPYQYSVTEQGDYNVYSLGPTGKGAKKPISAVSAGRPWAENG